MQEVRDVDHQGEYLGRNLDYEVHPLPVDVPMGRTDRSTGGGINEHHKPAQRQVPRLRLQAEDR